MSGSFKQLWHRLLSSPYLNLRNGLIALAVGGFAFFIWPTLYRYDHLNVKGQVHPVRINRITGRADVLWETGWRAAEKPKVSAEGDKAQTLFIEALRARPTDKEKALDLLNQSIDTKPTFNAYFHRAWLYALKNDDARANEDIKAGLALEPESTDLHWLEREMKKPAERRFGMPTP